MNAAVELLPALNGIPYFGSATVTDFNDANGIVQVKALLMGAERVVSARLAVQQPTTLSVKDNVLIAGNSIGELYVIGIVSRFAHSRMTKLTSASGACAIMNQSEASGHETIQVYSKRNELLFEYDPEKERARINVRKGNLDLSTEDGDICINSANDVRINGDAIYMDSNKLTANVGYAKFMFDRLETAVDTLVEQAKNVYRTVAQLTQLRTGRMRTLVDETYQFKADKVFMKSEDDFKIKGEKIHLG